MNRKLFSLISLVLIFTRMTNISSQDIVLPAPDKTGGKPLMQALNERQTSRTFTSDNLSLQQLSDILWAGWGVNRPGQNKRTAPSARDFKEIDVYAAMEGGLYIYVAEEHKLRQIHNRDIRSLCGTQDFVAQAPLNLIFVADLSRIGKKEGDAIRDADLFWSHANTGFIAQNVYLCCASLDLGCVVRGLVPKEKLAPEMQLKPLQVIILSQTIGAKQK
ncbi:MAG TPA: SagB/ThcOx family dehydrogenase [Bacteroidales bacterium]|nr:SagB/ThcOx family dehydrogenase [Bacteroidales bacterium]HPF02407.1 SagB/ThcOx family dehydrogenase [Bacteroidales bacterium]HPJ60606.1 SagB/ThcOx family dehydrogenase [Bacteroidales bacterium]HPR11100.1 SagB/ThcOx family dehydrogenase [Bacteroidales bacterium]HRW84799.1 SagB/ThcOx family dehydrogenase [Bacteroidales bacterium]